MHVDVATTECTAIKTGGKCPAIGSVNYWHTVCRQKLASDVRALITRSLECKKY